MLQRASPDHGGVLTVKEISHRYDLEILKSLNRNDIPVLVTLQLVFLDPEDFRHVGSVNVPIQNTHLVSLVRKAQGKIRSYRGFSHPAFAAHNHDGVFYCGQPLLEFLFLFLFRIFRNAVLYPDKIVCHMSSFHVSV